MLLSAASLASSALSFSCGCWCQVDCTGLTGESQHLGVAQPQRLRIHQQLQVKPPTPSKQPDPTPADFNPPLH